MLSQIELFKHFCDAIWEYDPRNGKVYIYHDTMVSEEESGCWIDYRSLYEEHREKFVYPKDLEIWKRYMSPEAMGVFLKGGFMEITFSIRMQDTKSGLQWHEVYLEKYEEHVLIASRDIKKEQRNATIARAVLPEFDYVCRIDVRTGSYVLYYADDEKTIVPQHESDNYEKVVEEFNHQYVVSESAAELTEKMRISNVVQQLEKKEEYVLYTVLSELWV